MIAGHTLLDAGGCDVCHNHFNSAMLR